MKKPTARFQKKSSKPTATPSVASSDTAAGTTSSGPSHPGPPKTAMAAHAGDQQALAAAMPANETKSSEYGYGNATMPSEGAHNRMPSPIAGAATLTEKNASDKTGPAAVRAGSDRRWTRPGCA